MPVNFFQQRFGRFFVSEEGGEQAMDHQVGVTPNGRGKVCVMTEGQPPMANILGRINRFGHRADGGSANNMMLGRLFRFTQHSINLARRDFAAFDGQVVAEGFEEGSQVGNLVHIGPVVNPIDEGVRLVVVVLRGPLGHLAIGEEHKVLN